jgi:signal transduction histidine kinase
MSGAISQEIQSDYQVTELKVGTNGRDNGRHGAASKADDADTNRIRQAEQQIEILNRFFYAYPAAVAAITACPNPEEVLEIFTREVINLLEVNCCHIYQWDSEASTVSLLVSSQRGSEHLAHPSDQAYQQSITPLIGRAIVERLPIQYSLVQTNIGGDSPSHQPEESRARTLLLMPMTGGEGKPTRVVVMESREQGIFSRYEILSAQRLASQAAVTAEHVQHCQELALANDQLLASNEALESYAHTVAHDLKGPLATIIGSAEFLKLVDESWPVDDLRELTTIITESSQKMLDIINGLLLLASVGQQNTEITPVEMSVAFSEALSRLEDTIEKHQAEVVVLSELPSGWGYGPWVEQVWTNLLSNAIKYGGQPPSVQVGATEMDDGTVRYWVRDNGNGLTQEQQARLFKPFTRLHDKSVSGHGLGLSIARRIVDRLGGEIGVESEPGKGCVFYFTLPSKAH